MQLEGVMRRIEGVAATLLVLSEKEDMAKFRGECNLYELLSSSLYECADELKEIMEIDN